MYIFVPSDVCGYSQFAQNVIYWVAVFHIISHLLLLFATLYHCFFFFSIVFAIFFLHFSMFPSAHDYTPTACVCVQKNVDGWMHAGAWGAYGCMGVHTTQHGSSEPHPPQPRAKKNPPLDGHPAHAIMALGGGDDIGIQAGRKLVYGGHNGFIYYNRWDGVPQRAGCWCWCQCTIKCHCVQIGECRAAARHRGVRLPLAARCNIAFPGSVYSQLQQRRVWAG